MVRELMVQLVTDGEQLKEIKDDWDELLESSQSSSVFLTWEWMYTWWNYFGRDTILRIVAVRNGTGRLIGLAPLCIRRKKGVLPVNVLIFMGTMCVSSEYLDVIAEPGYEGDVSSALLETLQKDDRSWDYAMFSDLLDSSVVIRHLKDNLQAAGHLIRQDLSQSCPYLPLPAEKEDFHNSLGKEMRSTLKRRTRRLLEMGAEIRMINEPEGIADAFQSLFQLHQKRWTLRGLSGNFREEQIRSFHLEVAGHFLEKEWLRLYLLKIRDNIIASLYCFQYKGRVFYFQSGFDPQWGSKSPGTVLMGYGIQDSIDQRMEEFDYLRGLEPYKFRWTSKVRKTWCLTAIPKGKIRGLLSFQLDQTLKATKRFVKKVVSANGRTGGISETR